MTAAIIFDRDLSLAFGFWKGSLFPVSKKTSTRSLKDVLLRQETHYAKKSCRCPKDILNANLKFIFATHLEDTSARYIVDVL